MYDPNVVGLDMRYKVVGGRETRDWAICVQVLEKKPISALSVGELYIPPAVETLTADPGVSAARELTPTDVIEVERPVLHEGFVGWYSRPAWGGLGIGIWDDDGEKMLEGTMTVVDWGGPARILSAGHVLNVRHATDGFPDRNKVKPLEPIFQPPVGGELDPPGRWREKKMEIGVMENGYPLFRYPVGHLGPYYFNTYDLAWALPRLRATSYAIGPGGLSPIWPQPNRSIVITDVDKIPQMADLETHGGPAYGLRVAFAGVATGMHEGRIKTVRSLMKTWGRNRQWCYLFRDLIRVEPTFGGGAKSGDSGSILIGLGTRKGAGLGSLVGGNAQSVYFARIPTANPGSGPLRQPNYAPGPDPPPEGGTQSM
ncbi:hypothetical protein OG357_37775 [Streptomyces sp. NBC_01255]|uniref:hypothetical protein n=1 Tax=Streptomyces sp. NBC_01255 TaxID=2903798 RepID=UPI002E381F15|nr:hypothetical protein [Streptomyces sp. NBC_01255]